ncbi:MAG: rhodanese-like domain-containing protein [Magnetococcus sp. WYHC-3]
MIESRRTVWGLLLLGAALLAGCSPPPYEDIDAARMQALMAEGVPVYDIRRPDEWARTGVLAGSRLLTYVDGKGQMTPGFLERFRSEVTPDKRVIILCRSGNRSAHLARQLEEHLGYTQVFNVEDGIKSWISDGLPVVPAPTAPPPTAPPP